MHHDIQKAFISFRIGVPLWLREERFAEVLARFDGHPGLTDEISFFTSETHPPLPLGEVVRRAEILQRRQAQAREHGYSAGVNVLATLGHHEENLPHALVGDYTYMTDLDGRTCRGSLCPQDERVQDYVREVYRLVAGSEPDFIWIDDDVRCMGHMPIRCGCFCDACLGRFAEESGQEHTRESLRAAFDAGSTAAKLAARKAWLAHNRQLLGRLFALIEETVHGVAPGLPLGFMTGDRFLEGYDFDTWAAVLAGAGGAEVRWRPGGGFYADEALSGLAGKSHDIGRQVSLLPATTVNVQSEIESFPYQRLQKAARTTALEAASHIAAGCTGAAFNVLSMYDEPLAEYEPLLAELQASRPFLDRLACSFGRLPPSGVFCAWGKDAFVTHNLAAGAWLAEGDAPLAIAHGQELLQLGLPAAYAPGAARLVTLAGDAPMGFDDATLLRMLSGGVLLDARALARLHERGFGALTGFAVERLLEVDCIEVLNGHPLNGPFAGRRRDGRQSFWKAPAAALLPLAPGAQALARLVDYAEAEVAACAMGVFENARGGRIGVAGYYPWTNLANLSKSTQIKRVVAWLCRETLPLYVESFHKVNAWARESAPGTITFGLTNASLDEARELTVMLRTTATAVRVVDRHCRETEVTASGAAGPYQRFVLPLLGPWEMILGRA
jgi:hypothetical protein